MRRVLIVDNDLDVVTEISRAVKEAGFVVGTASDAFEALAKLRSEPDYDCVVADYDMAGMNGLELAMRLRDRVQTPVVLMSVKATLPFEASYQSGVSGVLLKPVNIPTLVTFLRSNDFVGSSSFSNQRHYLRRPTTNRQPVKIEVSNGVKTSSGSLLNLSVGGVGAAIENKDMRLSTVRFTLSYEGQEIEGFMHCRWQGVFDEQLKVGFEFDSITKKELAQNPVFQKLLTL